MSNRLPPPDPHESYGVPPDDQPVPAPTAVYALGPPNAETDRLSDAILDLRPGVLVVVVPGG
jgi:hypothetical protein